jgi:hypothetical protein
MDTKKIVTAQAVFNLYTQVGVFQGLKKIGITHEGAEYIVNGLFHSENGYRNGKIAEFDNATDAVEFKALVQQSLKIN